MFFNDCIILAGGSGTRLWPASNSKNPKQFLQIPEQNSRPMNFLTAAIERAFTVLEESDDSKVIIIAGQNYINAVVDSCAIFSKARQKHLVIIPEPEAKNTAPAIACSLLYSDWVSGGQDRKILVLTSDHLISPLEVFKTDALAAAAFALQDRLIVFGIPPSSPNTGYGYIETSNLLTVPPGPNMLEQDYYEPFIYKAASFREKPDKKKAEAYLKAGNYYWNSGMFAFSLKFMLQEIHEKAPDLIEPFLKNLRDPNEQSYRIQKGIRILEKWEDIASAYIKAPKISFDYAIAEKCKRTVMVKAAFKWIDVGSWDIYAGLIPAQDSEYDENIRNPAAAGTEVYRVGSENTFVDSDIPVALVDAEDLIVVVRSGKAGEPKAILIAKKGETQKVQEIIQQIRESGRTDLL